VSQFIVSAGQTSSAITLSNGDTLTVLSAGTAVATIIDNGGAPIQDTEAKITDAVTGFKAGVDHLSFAGETAASEAEIIATAKLIGGNTVLTYPDHSTITLVGVTHVNPGIFT